MDPKQCAFWPSLGHEKVCKKDGRYSIEVQVQSVFRDQTVSWIKIVNGIDKFLREVMPIQEEEKASGKPAAQARPILEPSSTSGWDFTPMEQRQWVDVEIQESKDPHCFQVSKFIARLLRHSQQVNREEDAGVHYDQIIDEFKKKQSDNAGYWSDEVKKDFVNVLHWSIEKWISVLAKGGGQKKRFQYCLNLRNSCTVEQSKDIQEVQSILHCKTMYCFRQVSPSMFITSETEKN